MANNNNNYTFNPFSIGPPNSGASLDIKIPTWPSYPPPVFAITPKPKVHTNRSVSQDSMPQLQSKLSKMKGVKSQIGEVAISKAINEEMSISKQQAGTADEHQRIYGGGGTEMNVPSDLTKDVSDTTSMRTLLPVRMYTSSKLSVSSGMKKGNDSKSSVRSKVSGKSNLSGVSKASKETLAKSENASSKISMNSQESTSVAKTSISKVSKGSFDPSQSKSKNVPSLLSVKESKRSNLSKISKVSKKSTQILQASTSKMSVKSDSSSSTVKSSKKSINISIKKSDNSNILETTMKPHKSSNELEDIVHLSQHSVKSTKETGNPSQHSVQSKKEDTSRLDIQQKQSNQVDHESEHSISLLQKQSTQGDNVSQYSISLKKEPVVQKDLVKNIPRPITPPPSEFRKTLAEGVNELNNRLKAGNVSSFRRFDSLNRTFTNTEPTMLFRDDRMSQWFKEAVLS